MNTVIKLWAGWLRVSKIIGNFQAQVILSIFYLLILLPLGLIFRFINNPIRVKVKSTNFVAWEHPSEDLDQARKQY